MKKILMFCLFSLIYFSVGAKNHGIVKIPTVLKLQKVASKIETKFFKVIFDACTVYGCVQSPTGGIYTSHVTAATCEEAWQKMVDKMIALENTF
jgi:hypothetical protein